MENPWMPKWDMPVLTHPIIKQDVNYNFTMLVGEVMAVDPCFTKT